MGERKVALFCCIPDADTSLNYLVGMIYSQLFQTLYYMADRVHGGALPVPVNCIMDEFPNVSLPNEFEKILATCRSRSIYCSIIIQNMSQLKALFKDSWESLVGNCDEFLYLGGNEKETHKYVSELLGKETIDTNTYGQTKGKSGSYSTNNQITGRELMTPSELATMPGDKCILQLRGLPPFFSPKYDLKQHPNYKYTSEADKQKNAFDLDKLINRRRRPGLNEACEVYEVDVSDTGPVSEDEDILNYDDVDDPDAYV